jgi:hypothetical protein
MNDATQVSDENQTRALSAEHILHSLGRKERGQHYRGLREYVRWLLKKREKTDKLQELEERWNSFDDSLQEKIQAGELSGNEADLQRGDAIWWRVVEESRGASFYMALRIITKRELLAALINQPAKANETIDEIQQEIESQFVVKLRECLKASREAIDDIEREQKIESATVSVFERRKDAYEELAKGAE